MSGGSSSSRKTVQQSIKRSIDKATRDCGSKDGKKTVNKEELIKALKSSCEDSKHALIPPVEDKPSSGDDTSGEKKGHKTQAHNSDRSISTK